MLPITFELVKEGADLANPPLIKGVRYYKIFDTEKTDGFTHFVHGVAIEEFQGKLFAAWGDNQQSGKEENTISERARGCISLDGGLTWQTPFYFTPENLPYANSHGSFCVKDGELWFFAARFYGKHPSAAINFIGLSMEAFLLHNNSWESKGIVADDFWTYKEPVRMSNGSWITAGMNHSFHAAAAISHGDDLTHWEVQSLDCGEHHFSEATLWPDGNNVYMVIRNESCRLPNGDHPAGVAVSTNYGLRFSPVELSNMPMGVNKPYTVMLPDGRMVLAFTLVSGEAWDRRRMLLGISKPHEKAIDRVFLLKQSEKALAYPYIKLMGESLYIAYSEGSANALPNSCNQNDLELAVIPLTSLS